MIKLKNVEIYNLTEELEKLKDLKAPFKFHYALNKNKKNFERLLKGMPNYKPPTSNGYKEFLENVNSKIKKENIVFENAVEVDNFYKEEIKNYPEAEKERNDSLKTFGELLTAWENSEQEVEIYTVSEEFLPTDLDGHSAEVIIEYFLEQ